MPPPIASIPLLRVKMLAPAPGLAILRRSRLVDRLKEGLENLQRRATVVVAGAGYGKTTLVADFLRTSRIESVWYSLDPSDRDPNIFFRYIIDAVRERSPEFGRLAETMLDELPLAPGGMDRFVDVLITDATETLSGRTVIVMDDFHLVEASALILGAVRRLVAYLPDSMHIILISRTVPDIGVAHLKSKGTLGVIDQDELVFSEEETGTLITQVLGLHLDRKSIRSVQQRTQGWVTALQLLRQGAQGLLESSGQAPEAIFARTEAEIFDYFSEGVLAGEPEEVQRFLRRSSPPAILEPEICARVLDDLPVRGILQSLLRRNLFIVPLAGRTDDYVYHPLFREFMNRKLLQVEGLGETRELHRRYARCFEERGEIAPALHHYMQALDQNALDSLLSREGFRLIEHGMIETVRTACATLRQIGPMRPRTDLLAGEIARITGDYAAAASSFARGLADAGLGDVERAAGLQGLAYVELRLGDLPRSVAHAEEALRLAGNDMLLRAKILNTISIAAYRSGRYDAAIEGWRQALDLARRGSDQALVRKVAHNLGLPYAMRGEYDKAIDYFRILLSPSEEGEPGLGPDSATASLNIARIEILRGEFREAARHLDDALENTGKYHLRALLGDVLEAQGNLLRETGDLDGAREKYAGARRIFTELGLEELAAGLQEEETLLLLAAGSTHEALRRATEILASRESAAPERLAPALLLAGEARLAAGDPKAAVGPLERARAIYGELSFTFLEAEAGLLLARAHLESGDRRAAAAPARESMELARRYGYQHMTRRVAAASAALSSLLEASGGAGPPSGRASRAAATRSLVEPRVGGALGGYDLTINLLGPVEVYRDELRKIPASAWVLKRALRILCYVSASRDHRATKDRIIDTFWKETRSAIIEKNFHPTISYLRKALNFSHNVGKNFILFEKGAYLLNPAYKYRLDTAAFEAAIARARRQARSRDPQAAIASYREALELYRGDFLDEEYDEWVEAPRAHYRGLLEGALEEAGALHCGRDQIDEALACYERLTRIDPLSESHACLLISCYGVMGNRSGIEREYGRLCLELKREMDLEPMPETVAAYEKALAHRPSARRRGAVRRGKGSRLEKR